MVLVGLKPVSVANWLQCFDAVGWVIWPVKIVPEMTYKVSSGTLNLCSLSHSALLSHDPSKTRVPVSSRNVVYMMETAA